MKKPPQTLLTLLMVASATWFSGTTVSAQTRTADGLQGMNWANPTDNAVGAAYPYGMTGNENYEQAVVIGQKVGNAVKNAGGRTVRMPITTTLATGVHWWRYAGAINGVTSTGLKVILCWWSDTGHHVGNINSWYAMWDAVNASYGNTMSVRYEPINEPLDYNATDLCNLYAAFLNRYRPADYKCILAGTGWEENVVPVGNDSRLSRQLLGIHAYHWYFGSHGSWRQYYDSINQRVGSHAWRTVMTEIGVGNAERPGIAFWQQWRFDEEADVALLNGALAWARDNDVATVAWSGVNSPNTDTYRWFNSWDNMTETNGQVSDMFRWSWKVKNAVVAGTYRLQNRADGLLLDNLGSASDGTNIVQWASSASNNQKWKLVQQSSVWYRLQNVATGKFVDGIGRTADGSALSQWADSGSWNQRWALSATDSGYYKLINATTGKCIDTGGLTANGSTVQQWNVGWSYNQEWKFGN